MRDAPYSSSRNSFHLMRVVLALLVIICHSHTLLGVATPLNRLTGGQLNEGSLAVDGFLVISGFLICQSGVRSYIATRILEGSGYEAYNFSGGFRFYDAVMNDRALIETAFPCGMDKA